MFFHNFTKSLQKTWKFQTIYGFFKNNTAKHCGQALTNYILRYLGAGCREFEPLHSDQIKVSTIRLELLFFCNELVLIPNFLNTIRRLPALGTTRDRVRGTMQGVNGAPEKRKLLRGLEPQRSYELFDWNEKTICVVMWRKGVAVKIVSDEQERSTILGTAKGTKWGCRGFESLHSDQEGSGINVPEPFLCLLHTNIC